MFWTDLKRIIRSGLVNFSRNGVVSVASVLISTITLSVITALIFLQAILHFSVDQIQQKVDVTVYFTVGAPEEKIASLKSSLEKLPEVSEVDSVSAEQALENFRTRHSDDFLTIQALDELNDNPLGAYLNIRAKETSQYETIANFLESETALEKGGSLIIDKINYHQNKLVIDRLIALMDSAKKLGFAITLVLSIISVVITFNTIRLAIYIAREEIAIMRLVGANTRYVQGPFMVEGMIYGAISAVLTMLIFWPTTYWVGKTTASFLGLNVFDYYTGNFFQIFGIILVSGLLLGSLSAFLAIRKYLNK